MHLLSLSSLVLLPGGGCRSELWGRVKGGIVGMVSLSPGFTHKHRLSASCLSLSLSLNIWEHLLFALVLFPGFGRGPRG